MKNVAIIILLSTSLLSTYDISMGSGVNTGFITCYQPNTVTFTARLWGDEFAIDLETDDGYRIIQGSDDYYYYAELDANGEYTPSTSRVAIDPPLASSYQLQRSASRLTEIQEEIDEFNQELEQRALEFAQEQEAAGFGTIIKTIGVLLVDFTPSERGTSGAYPLGYYWDHYYDLIFSDDTYNTSLTGATSPDGDEVFGSLTDYYQDQSNGLLEIQGTVVNPRDPVIPVFPVWIVLPQSKSYYDSLNLVVSATVSAAKNLGYIDDQLYNGGYDVLIVIYAGKVRFGWLWPRYSGNRYRMSELWNWTSRGISPTSQFSHVGVHAHEFGHDLGFPDSRQGFRTYHWLLHDSGDRNGPYQQLESAAPSALDPEGRITRKWATPIDILTGGSDLVISYSYPVPNFYKIDMPGTSEYFILENRLRSGFDEYTANNPEIQANEGDVNGNQGGLLIWHIDPAVSSSRVELKAADADMRAEELPNENYYTSDPWPIYQNQDFNALTIPNSNDRDGNRTNIALQNIRWDDVNKTVTVDIYLNLAPITGTIPANTFWNYDVLLEGDLNLSGENIVSSGVTMRIAPGATLKFEDGSKLTVKGQLIAEGTASDIITFRSINDNAPAASWGSIHIDLRGGPQDPTSIKYVHVQDANIGVLGMWANNTVVENSTFQNCKIGPYAWNTEPGSPDRMQILNNTITDNTRHGIYNYYSHPIISGNTITDVSDPSSNYGFGIYLRSSSAIVGNNTITGSKRDGIQGYGSGAAKIYYSSSSNPLGGGNSITNNTGNGVYVTASSAPILGWSSGTPGNNIIVNNSGKEIYNNTSSAFNATCNDWGGSEPLSSELFGVVYYDPWIGPNGVCDQYAAIPANPLSGWLYAMLNVIPSDLYAQGNGIPDRNRQATGEFASGNYEEAARLFKEIIRDFPNADGVQYALTLAYESHRELSKRRELRTYLTGLSNQQANTKVKRLAKLLIMHDMEGAGEFTEALEAGDKLLSENPSDEELNEVLFRQGMIHAWLDESGLAAQKFNEIIRRFPDTDEAMFAAEQLEYLEWDGLGKGAFGGKSDKSTIPKKYSLSNNFPNPFNPKTKIDFALPEDGFTRLVIYDLRGREVVRLIDKNLNSGYHTTVWNASRISSGIYFYRLTSGSFVATKKMLLLK